MAANAIQYLCEREEIAATTPMRNAAALALALQKPAKKPGVITAAATLGDLTRSIELAVSDTDSIPSWLEPAMVSALKLLLLPTNWDLEGGHPIGHPSILAALRALRELMNDGSSLPQWLPTSEGGVQLEWHESKVDLEIEFNSQGTDAYVVFGDLVDSRDWDGSLRENVDRLQELFKSRLQRKGRVKS